MVNTLGVTVPCALTWPKESVADGILYNDAPTFLVGYQTYLNNTFGVGGVTASWNTDGCQVDISYLPTVTPPVNIPIKEVVTIPLVDSFGTTIPCPLVFPLTAAFDAVTYADAPTFLVGYQAFLDTTYGAGTAKAYWNADNCRVDVSYAASITPPTNIIINYITTIPVVNSVGTTICPLSFPMVLTSNSTEYADATTFLAGYQSFLDTTYGAGNTIATWNANNCSVDIKHGATAVMPVNIPVCVLTSFTWQFDGTVLAITPQVLVSAGGYVPKWDWGDGSPIEQTQTPTHTFTGTAPFTVTVTVCPETVLEVIAVNSGQTGDMSTYSGWGALVNVQNITLPGGSITGALQPSWSALTKLTNFVVYNNQITGTLPTTWSTWTLMDKFSAGKNQITGSLPTEWSTWTVIDKFLVQENQITGSLPTVWSTWTNVGTFLATQNQLTGTLPTEWSTWTMIDRFQVDVNQLTGTLPDSWSSWTVIDRFYAGYNMLTGVLPTAWSAWNGAREFSVPENMLSGTLPTAWSSWSGTQRFIVGSNGITGSGLPATYVWPALLVLDISDSSGITGVLDLTNVPLVRTLFASATNISSVTGISTLTNSAINLQLQCNGFNQATVDSIINQAVVYNQTNGRLELDDDSSGVPKNRLAFTSCAGGSGGSNAAPSAAGLADIAILIGRSWAQQTN